MEPDEQPGIFHEEVSFSLSLSLFLYFSIQYYILVFFVMEEEEEEEEGLTRWLLAYCLGKSGRGE